MIHHADWSSPTPWNRFGVRIWGGLGLGEGELGRELGAEEE